MKEKVRVYCATMASLYTANCAPSKTKTATSRTAAYSSASKAGPTGACAVAVAALNVNAPLHNSPSYWPWQHPPPVRHSA